MLATGSGSSCGTKDRNRSAASSGPSNQTSGSNPQNFSHKVRLAASAGQQEGLVRDLALPVYGSVRKGSLRISHPTHHNPLKRHNLETALLSSSSFKTHPSDPLQSNLLFLAHRGNLFFASAQGKWPWPCCPWPAISAQIHAAFSQVRSFKYDQFPQWAVIPMFGANRPFPLRPMEDQHTSASSIFVRHHKLPPPATQSPERSKNQICKKKCKNQKKTCNEPGKKRRRNPSPRRARRAPCNRLAVEADAPDEHRHGEAPEAQHLAPADLFGGGPHLPAPLFLLFVWVYKETKKEKSTQRETKGKNHQFGVCGGGLWVGWFLKGNQMGKPPVWSLGGGSDLNRATPTLRNSKDFPAVMWPS